MSAPDCPECGAGNTYERTATEPAYRCRSCGHAFAAPAEQCCVAGVETPPSGRPYCGGCGRVLANTDDPRVTEAEA